MTGIGLLLIYLRHEKEAMCGTLLNEYNRRGRPLELNRWSKEQVQVEAPCWENTAMEMTINNNIVEFVVGCGRLLLIFLYTAVVGYSWLISCSLFGNYRLLVFVSFDLFVGSSKCFSSCCLGECVIIIKCRRELP